LSHSASPFCVGYFLDRVSRTICLGWAQTKILLISASRVARITRLSHWYPADLMFVIISHDGRLFVL
jgi:hypothetical protein